MTNLVVETRQLFKRYPSPSGDLEVLRNLNMEMHQGEMLAIMGLSGVGKSTLLNILGLLDHPTEGDLIYHVDNEAIPAHKLTSRRTDELRNQFIGFVFQFFHLLPDLNVLENILLPTMIHRSSRQFRREKAVLTARAEELLDRVGLRSRQTHLPRQLSGGERQRVAIARALINEPGLLLCDEPTGNLDTVTSASIHDLFRELNRELNTSILIVTHDPHLADLADRKLEMVDGCFL